MPHPGRIRGAVAPAPSRQRPSGLPLRSAGHWLYREFAAAAWDGYQAAVKAKLAPHVPPQPLHGATYMAQHRVRLADLPALPEGWGKERPNLTAVNHDWLMSRWLDDLVDGVAVTGKGGQEKGADWFEGNRWKTGNGFLL